MKSTLACAALLVLLVLSVNARIIDRSEIDPFPPGCRSILKIRVQGFGEDFFETEARRQCVESCDVGIETFKRDRCPAFCALEPPRPPPKDRRKSRRICELCPNRPNDEIYKCELAVDSLVERCKRGCRNNVISPSTFYRMVRSTSGGSSVRFPSVIRS